MSLRVEPLKESDFYDLKPQEEQDNWLQCFGKDVKEAVLDKGLSYTIWDQDDPIFIGGALYTNDYTASVWAVVSRSFREGKNKFFVTRKVIEFLDHLQYNDNMRRLQTTVVIDFNEGHRWAKILGFEVEGLMRAFEPDGRDTVLYGRVK